MKLQNHQKIPKASKSVLRAKLRSSPHVLDRKQWPAFKFQAWDTSSILGTWCFTFDLMHPYALPPRLNNMVDCSGPAGCPSPCLSKLSTPTSFFHPDLIWLDVVSFSFSWSSLARGGQRSQSNQTFLLSIYSTAMLWNRELVFLRSEGSPANSFHDIHELCHALRPKQQGSLPAWRTEPTPDKKLFPCGHHCNISFLYRYKKRVNGSATTTPAHLVKTVTALKPTSD